jgi:hypothetical protein
MVSAPHRGDVIRKTIVLALLILLSLLVPLQIKRMTHGFRIAKMHLDPSFRAAKPTEMPTQEILAILSQPFSYLDKGAQSYVFASKDGHYVIKLFRFRKKAGFHKTVERIFSASQIAYDNLSQETGVVYIHLNPTEGLKPLCCKDSLGRRHKVSLDNTRFALQRRAKPFRKTLEEARSDPALMQKRLDSLIDLLCRRVEKGVANSDPTLSRNFGFLEEQAVEIDFGNYFFDPSLARKERQLAEMGRYLARLRRWLIKAAPEWVSYLDKKAAWLQAMQLDPSRSALD